MPAGRYIVEKPHAVAAPTREHVVQAFMTFATGLTDWGYVTKEPVDNYLNLCRYKFDPGYIRRLQSLDKFLGPKLDLSKPLFFMSQADITKDLGMVLFCRYFAYLRRTKKRYPYSFDCKNVLFVRDVYTELRTGKNNKAPTDMEVHTEQDIVQEILYLTGDCADAGFTWSGAIEALMENRASEASTFSNNLRYNMVTWGFFRGTQSDIDNNPSEKGMSRLFSFFQRKKEMDGWQIIDLNQVNGYQEAIGIPYAKVNEDMKKYEEQKKEEIQKREEELLSSMGVNNLKGTPLEVQVAEKARREAEGNAAVDRLY